MSTANEHVFSHGMQDTRAALDGWREGHWSVLRAWLLLSLAMYVFFVVFGVAAIQSDVVRSWLGHEPTPFFSGFPVTGSISRSAVNYTAGANTQLAGLITAALLALALVAPTGWLALLPLMMWARVRVGAHTPGQVAAGALFGLLVPMAELWIVVRALGLVE